MGSLAERSHWAVGVAAAARLPQPVHDPGEVRRVTREVLSRPELHQPRPSLIAQARRWLLDQLGRLLARVLEGAHGSVVGWLVVAALVALIVYVAMRFVRGTRRDPEREARLPAAPRRSAADWRAEADAEERRGAWRRAVRCRYRALVADLAARGLIDEVPGRTAGEYRVEVARNVPPVAADFAGATELFELAWYGNAPTGPDEAVRVRDLARRVLEDASR